MKNNTNRREFIKRTSLTASGLFFAGRIAMGKDSPNEKINVGFVGVANRAGADLSEVAKLKESVNVAALCDVDEVYLAKVSQEHPSAVTYNDYRKMMEQKDLDAIVVATPDHTHAVITMAALKSGRHVYCEKPLTHTISEARIITETARKLNRVTQLGTQIHAGSNYRRVVELIQSNAIGPVKEVHVWVAATYGGMDKPTDIPPVPSTLHYDEWLGPVEYRPYSPEYIPFKWRNWWAFGGGALADFGCHYMDLPHWALDLKYPQIVAPVDGPVLHPESTPPWLIVRYEYPARDAKPPVKLTWYHGGKFPALLSAEQHEQWKSGVLFIGEKGQLLADYTRHVLLPEKNFADFKAPAPTIPDSIGHHKEWVEACKTGAQTTCGFDYGGPLTEAALLGNVAYRVGKRLQWDSWRLRATNAKEADYYIQHHYRTGWSL